MKPNQPGRFASLSDFQRQHSFVFLFGGLLLLLLIAPVLEKSNASRELLAVFTTLILFSGVYSSFKESRWLAVTVFLLATLNILTLWWEYAFWSKYMALVHYLGLFIFFFLITVIILRQNSRETSVSHNVIYGAVTVYLLIAFNWALLFASLYLLDPGSFRNLAVADDSYFSIVPFWYLSFLHYHDPGLHRYSADQRSGQIPGRDRGGGGPALPGPAGFVISRLAGLGSGGTASGGT